MDFTPLPYYCYFGFYVEFDASAEIPNPDTADSGPDHALSSSPPLPPNPPSPASSSSRSPSGRCSPRCSDGKRCRGHRSRGPRSSSSLSTTPAPGKPTLLRMLKDGVRWQRLVQHQPTQYPTSDELSIGKIKLKAFDLGGHQIIRNVWKDYYAKKLTKELLVQ